jgi:regulator of CtrA degradation
LWHFSAMGEQAIMDGQLAPRLVDGLYVEAMVLADEARSYFDTGGRDDRLALDPLDRVGFSCESLKVTTRLMHVIAWLLTQRAVAAGELSRAQAGAPERRLGAAADTDPDLFQRLPEAAAALIRASEDLYGRVSRLDRGGGAGEAGSPARSLLGRLQRSL